MNKIIFLLIAITILLFILLAKNSMSVGGHEPNYCPLKEILSYKFIIATAYTSSPEETDSTPCITASGLNICPPDRLIFASNMYEFGQKIKVGGSIWENQDRMNKRYKNRIDLLMSSKNEAKNFGVQKLLIQEL